MLYGPYDHPLCGANRAPSFFFLNWMPWRLGPEGVDPRTVLRKNVLKPNEVGGCDGRLFDRRTREASPRGDCQQDACQIWGGARRRTISPMVDAHFGPSPELRLDLPCKTYWNQRETYRNCYRSSRDCRKGGVFAGPTWGIDGKASPLRMRTHPG